MNLIKYGNSGDSSELISTIPVNGGTQQIFVLDLNADGNPIKIGDLITATAMFEATNNTGVTVGWGGRLIMADSPTAIGGTEITEASGRNITVDMHHDTLTMSGNAIVANASRRYLIALITAQSTGTNGNLAVGDGVNQDYGRLSYEIYREPTYADIEILTTITLP